MLPEEVVCPGQTGRPFVSSEDQQEEETHEGIYHLGGVGLIQLVLLIDLQQGMADLRVLSGIEIQVGGRLFPLQGNTEEAAQQVAVSQLVPEDPAEGGGPDHIEGQYGIVLIAGRGVDNARGRDQDAARGKGHDLVLEMNGTVSGKGIVDLEIGGRVPVGRVIAQHAAYGNVLS